MKYKLCSNCNDRPARKKNTGEYIFCATCQYIKKKEEAIKKSVVYEKKCSKCGTYFQTTYFNTKLCKQYCPGIVKQNEKWINKKSVIHKSDDGLVPFSFFKRKRLRAGPKKDYNL